MRSKRRTKFLLTFRVAGMRQMKQKDPEFFAYMSQLHAEHLEDKHGDTMNFMHVFGTPERARARCL